ncbi:hypothetical protein CSKR_100111 [Clonorchis sinensis]|uniref:Uncharacterized protein n=1 Tax=Clonorchis sinensis TaxID=79923 RepID=A0A3R7F4M7_CLOSI|nr:hypothetical protein CSKR_100111 [Clonorchis sinensis]
MLNCSATSSLGWNYRSTRLNFLPTPEVMGMQVAERIKYSSLLKTLRQPTTSFALLGTHQLNSNRIDLDKDTYLHIIVDTSESLVYDINILECLIGCGRLGDYAYLMGPKKCDTGRGLSKSFQQPFKWCLTFRKVTVVSNSFLKNGKTKVVCHSIETPSCP